MITAKEVLDDLEMWRRNKEKRDKNGLIHTKHLSAKIYALREKL